MAAYRAAASDVQLAGSVVIGQQCSAAGHAQTEARDANPRFEESVVRCILAQGLKGGLQGGSLLSALSELDVDDSKQIKAPWGEYNYWKLTRQLARVRTEKDFFLGIIHIGLDRNVVASFRAMLFGAAMASSDPSVRQRAKEELAGLAKFSFEQFLKHTTQSVTEPDALLLVSAPEVAAAAGLDGVAAAIRYLRFVVSGSKIAVRLLDSLGAILTGPVPAAAVPPAIAGDVAEPGR